MPILPVNWHLVAQDKLIPASDYHSLAGPTPPRFCSHGYLDPTCKKMISSLTFHCPKPKQKKPPCIVYQVRYG